MSGYYGFGAMWIVIWLIGIGVAVGLAFIPASIARKKGYSYGGFWVFGFFLFIPAIIVAAVIDDKNVYGAPQYGQQNAQQTYSSPASGANTKFCTQCGSQIPSDARFCQSCGAKQ